MRSKTRGSPSDYRKRKEFLHKSLLEALSAKLLQKLFSDLGIVDYVVREIFVEPRSYPRREEISPDLVIFYSNPDFNLLLVEAKSSSDQKSLINLEQQLYNLKALVAEDGKVNPIFYETLRRKIPYETLQSCSFLAVGVYGTKNSFKIYRTERLK